MGRHRITLDVEWENPTGRHPGTINDISAEGCFVLTAGDVEDGENVKIFFPLKSGSTVQFWGKVVNHAFEIGFGVRFVGLTAVQEEYLQNYVELLKED